MAYIDQTYFSENSNIAIPEALEFSLLNQLAEDIINSITLNLQGYELTALPADVQEKIKNSVVRQIESLYMSGGIEALTGSAPESANIGRFSYSDGGSTGMMTGVFIPPIIKLILGSTGLLYRGVAHI